MAITKLLNIVKITSCLKFGQKMINIFKYIQIHKSLHAIRTRHGCMLLNTFTPELGLCEVLTYSKTIQSIFLSRISNGQWLSSKFFPYPPEIIHEVKHTVTQGHE